MPHRLLNARLAAKTSIRQVEATLYTDKIGRAADRLIRSWWPQIVGAVTGRMGAHDAAYHAERIIHAMFEQLVELFMGRFEGLANWSHQDSGHDLAKTLPLDYLRASAAEHLVRTGPHAKRLTEAAGDPKPGVIELALSALGLQTTDRAALLREPETTDLSDAQQRELFAKLLFPPLSKGQVAYIVYKPVHGLTWLDRLGNATKAASAKTLAPILIQSFSLGRTPRQVAQDLLPLVDGIQSTARRIARTEGIRIANESGMEADDALGSLLIGKQILAQLDQNTRPKHRARHGTVYYKNPKRGQKGYDEMPRPPIDPDGSTQWNCLLPGNRIKGEFVRGFKAGYAGQAIELTCASGASIHVTANHPIMTPHGFVAAKELAENDYVLSYVEGIDGRLEHEEDAPSLIQNVFGSLAEFASVITTRPASFEEFHGDAIGFDTDVQIVLPQRILAVASNAGESKSHSDPLGISICSDFANVPRPGSHQLPMVWIDFAATGYMSSFNLAGPISRRHELPFVGFGFGLAAQRHASGLQTERDCVSADPVFLGDSIDRLATAVQFGQRLNARQLFGDNQPLGFSPSTHDKTALGEPDANSSPSQASALRKFLERFPGQVSRDKIVKIKRFHYSGPVYDCESTSGCYAANYTQTVNSRILVSNCRCRLAVVLAPSKRITSDPQLMAVFQDAKHKAVADPITYAEWFAKADDKRRGVAVGARRYRTMAAQLEPGEQISWEHFLDAKTAEPLPLKTLEAESAAKRAERVAKVRALLAERRRLIQQVGTFGFLLPK